MDSRILLKNLRSITYDFDKLADLDDSKEEIVKERKPIDWKPLWKDVKYQGECGACWAFASVGAVEGVYNLKNKPKNLITLSAQHLVDCDPRNKGCYGGWPLNALRFVKENGVVEETAYPYIESKGACKNTTSTIYKISSINECHKYYMCTIDSWYNNLSKGPVVAAIETTGKFTHYRRGIITYDPKVETCKYPNHAIIVSGWGIDSQVGEYLIVRNSWSEDWGLGGYAKIKIEPGNDTCHITAINWLPIL